MKNLVIIEPQGYINFMNLVMNSRLVLSDSGGVQSETTYMGIPCLTLRDATEKPSTIRERTNVLVGNDKKKIIKEAIRSLEGGFTDHKIPNYWDGNSAKRIVNIIFSEMK